MDAQGKRYRKDPCHVSCLRRRTVSQSPGGLLKALLVAMLLLALPLLSVAAAMDPPAYSTDFTNRGAVLAVWT